MADGDWDDWNPMTEDYNDKNLNTYNTGAGARIPLEMQPANLRGGGEKCFTLWVSPINSRHSEDSLRNIFSAHGHVTDVKIVYPKQGSSFAYVTYKSQTSATDAIRGFNDNDKFDFKCQYARDQNPRGLRSNDRHPRNNHSNNFRSANDSGPPSRRSDSNRNEESSNVSNSSYEPSFEFTKAQKTYGDRNSADNSRSGDNTVISSHPPPKDRNSSPSKMNSVERDSCSFEPRDNAQPCPRPSSIQSVVSSTLSTRNVNENIMESENLNANKEPDDKPKPAKTYLKQMPCCHCKTLTWNVCKECGKSFCHVECSLDSWRCHTTADCMVIAEIVKQGMANVKPAGNTSIGSEQTIKNVSFADECNSNNVSIASDRDSKNVSFSNECDGKNATVTSERDLSINDYGVRKYAGDYDSPGTEYKNFRNLANDYLSNSNKSSEDASSQLPKSNTVYDNHYDDNTPKIDTPPVSPQIQPASQFQPEGQKFQRQDGANNYERGRGKDFKPRENNRDGSNQYGRGGGRNFRPRNDNKDEANDYNRQSGGDRREFNQRQQNGNDYEQGGGRNYQNNRDGRSRFERRNNLNEKYERKQNDEVDNADNGVAKPFRGGYQNDRNGHSDSKVNFDRSRGGYSGRSKSQIRIDGVSNTDAGRQNDFSNENRDSKSSGGFQHLEPKELELNQIHEVTIVSIEPDSNKCFVRIAENEGRFQELLKNLQEIPFPPLERKPKLADTKCIALLNDEWQRGFIRSEAPGIKVSFVDVGIATEVELQNIREVPKFIADIKKFAHRVELSNMSRDEISKLCDENTVFSMKATSLVNDGRWFLNAEIVSFEEQLADVRKVDHRNTQRPSVPTPAPLIPPTPASVAVAQPVVKQIPQLRSKQSVEVYVSYVVNEKEFYVVFVESICDLTSKLKAIQVDSLSTMIDIRNGLALAPYLDELCRAEVVSTDPLKVSFIDYGNVELCEAKDLKILPAPFTTVPPLATKVKLIVGTIAEFNVTQDASIVITPVMKEVNNTWLVVVGEKSAAECESLLQQVQVASRPALPKPKVAQDFYVTFVESKQLIYGVPKPHAEILSQLNEKLVPSASFRPAATPLVLNKVYVKIFEDFWCRARLISFEPNGKIEIYYIDYGNSETCQKEDLFELPSEMQKDPPDLAVKLTLERESRGIIEFGQYVSVLWDMEKDTYLLTLDPSDPDSSKASNKIVNVVSTLGDSNYAVILEENRSVYKYIYQIINSNVDQLGKPKKIEINGLCLAIYEDENWHRAKIVKKSPLSVSFLDFANEMPCDFSQLRVMPPEVACIPPLAFKIKTEDFIELEEGSEVKITLIEELEHNHWKVATIKEKDRQIGSKRIEIISDPKHIAQTTKKQAKKPAIATSPVTTVTTSTPTPEDVIVIDGEDDGVARIPKAVQSKGRSLIKPFDETSLVLTRLSNKPQHFPRGLKTITNGVEELSVIEPQRNSTFYDINVPVSQHLLDMLNGGDSCILIVYDSLSDDEYTGMIICKKFELLVDALDRIEESISNAETISAKRGDLVAIFVNGINNWHRGYVVNEPSNVNPYYLLILFDAGRLYKTDNVYRLEDIFRHVPQLAVRINVTHFQPVPDDITRLEVVPMNVNLIEGDTHQHDKSIYRVELTRKSEDGFEATLMSQFSRDSVSHTINVTKWRPTREEIGIKHVPVMAGDLVKIGDIRQTNQCHIIPFDEAINEQRMEFLSKVTTHCKRAKSIESELKLNEIVGVPHMQSYYRAQIIERKKDSYVARILDTGEEIKVLKSNIKPLPDTLKFADCFAISIQLHDVPCTDFTQLAANVVKNVVDHECSFLMEINECTRLIELISNEEFERASMKKGTSFNLILRRYLAPMWKLEDLDFNARYYLMQMKFEEWAVGSELSLHFAETLDDRSGLMINRYGETYSKIFRVNLHQRLKEYAEETIEQSYVPIKEELCVAKFEENWFRAVCVHAEPGKSIELQFLDIGYKRTVPHTDIRRMHSDFLKHPAAAIFCNVVNYRDCRSLPELAGKVLKKCRVLRKIEEGGYDIQIVNLRAYQ